MSPGDPVIVTFPDGSSLNGDTRFVRDAIHEGAALIRWPMVAGHEGERWVPLACIKPRPEPYTVGGGKKEMS